MDSEKFSKMKVADLKVELGKLGLSKTGLKSELVKRLEDYHSSNGKTEKKDDAKSEPLTKKSSIVISSDEEEEVKNGKRVKNSNSNDRKKRKLGESSEVSVNESDPVPEFHRFREGPFACQLEPFVAFNKQDYIFSNENTEVQYNPLGYSYYPGYLKTNIKVNKRSWYFEVKVTNRNRAEVGFCTSKFKSNQTSEGDYWVFKLSENQKCRFNQQPAKYGSEYITNGDVIGCALDVEAKTIKFFKNGNDLGVAFNDVVISSDDWLSPFIGITSGVKLCCNFGKSNYSFPQDGYLSFHSRLTNSHLKMIGNVFNKYLDIANNDDKENGDEPKETIHGAGLIEFQKDLTKSSISATEDEEDPVMLIIAWKFKAETVWEFSRDEFMNGMWLYECYSIEKLRDAVKDWKKDLKMKDVSFKQFYNFVFDYLKEDKTILLLDEAITTWNIILKDRKWAKYDLFIQFLRDTGKKSISRDAWQQLWNFMLSFPNDLKDYDKDSCWPILYDDFVEWIENKDKEKAKEAKK